MVCALRHLFFFFKVRSIEKLKKCRVVHLAAEFVTDRRGQPWLHRVTTCLTSVDGPAVHTTRREPSVSQ